MNNINEFKLPTKAVSTEISKSVEKATAFFKDQKIAVDIQGARFPGIKNAIVTVSVNIGTPLRTFVQPIFVATDEVRYTQDTDINEIEGITARSLDILKNQFQGKPLRDPLYCSVEDLYEFIVKAYSLLAVTLHRKQATFINGSVGDVTKTQTFDPDTNIITTKIINESIPDGPELISEAFLGHLKIGDKMYHEVIYKESNATTFIDFIESLAVTQENLNEYSVMSNIDMGALLPLFNEEQRSLLHDETILPKMFFGSFCAIDVRLYQEPNGFLNVLIKAFNGEQKSFNILISLLTSIGLSPNIQHKDIFFSLNRQLLEGTYISGGKTKSLSNITISEVYECTNDILTIQQFESGSLENYQRFVSSFNNQAIVTGRVQRIYFTGQFIEAIKQLLSQTYGTTIASKGFGNINTSFTHNVDVSAGLINNTPVYAKPAYQPFNMGTY